MKLTLELIFLCQKHTQNQARATQDTNLREQPFKVYFPTTYFSDLHMEYYRFYY